MELFYGVIYEVVYEVVCGGIYGGSIYGGGIYGGGIYGGIYGAIMAQSYLRWMMTRRCGQLMRADVGAPQW